MKRLLFGIVALCALVACSGDKGVAEKQMADYKQQWVDITSVVDAEAVDAEGFDAWYNSLSNIEVREVYKAVDEFYASYDEVEHWFKNLRDDEQTAARDAAIGWERENVAAQHQIELFAKYVMELNLAWEKDNKGGKLVAAGSLKEYPLINMLAPEADAPALEDADAEVEAEVVASNEESETVYESSTE